MTVELSYDTCAPLVDAVFAARHPSGATCDLRLTEVRDLGERMNLPERFRRPFSLYFRAPEDVDWDQGTFELTHEAVGTHSVFCVPIIDPDALPGRLYEVIFA